MPLVVQLPMLPSGFLAEDSFGGKDAPALVTEFLTTEDGNDFVQRAEGVSTIFREAFGRLRLPPSQVDHLLAVIRPDCGPRSSVTSSGSRPSPAAGPSGTLGWKRDRC